MSLITDAKAFMDKLLHRRDERVCPRCGSTLTKKNGHRRCTLRDLGGVHLGAAESDEEIERAFDLAAKAGLNLERITVFTSDGAAGFRKFLARCLYGVRH